MCSILPLGKQPRHAHRSQVGIGSQPPILINPTAKTRLQWGRICFNQRRVKLANTGHMGQRFQQGRRDEQTLCISWGSRQVKEAKCLSCCSNHCQHEPTLSQVLKCLQLVRQTLNSKFLPGGMKHSEIRTVTCACGYCEI